MQRLTPRAFRSVIGLVLVAVTITGCWNRREVNEVAPVSAVAIDRDQDGQVRVTVQVVTVAALAGGQAKDGQQAPARAVFTLTAADQTLLGAIDKLNHQVARPLGWEHNNVIIFSEAVARAGVADYLDFFVRDHSSRLDQWVLVARGPAAPVLDYTVELYANAGVGIRNLYRHLWLSSGRTTATRLYEFLPGLFVPTQAALAGVVEPLRPEETGDQAPHDAPKPRIGGGAVFEGDRLVGWLTDREARGIQWLRGKVFHGIVTAPCRDGEGRGVNVEVQSTTARMVTQWPGGELPRIQIPIRVTVRLASTMCREDLSTPAAIDRLAARVSATIRQEASDALTKVQQELNADPLGIGEALQRAYPRRWPEWERRWQEVFPKINVDLSVRVEFTQTGTTLGKPLPKAGTREGQ